MNLPELGFLRPPPGLPPAEAKLFTVRCALPAIAASMHGVQVFVFVGAGLPELAVLSAGSIVWFAVAIALMRHGWTRVGVWLAFAEPALHMSLLAALLGSSAGYAMYAFPFANVPFLVFGPDERRSRAVAVAIAVAIAVVLFGWAPAPRIVVESAVASAFFAMNVAGVVFALVATTAWFDRAASLAERAVAEERERTERLIRNILPAPIAERLKRDPGTIADRFDDVTVLFADLVGFTELSAAISGEALVEMLNELFTSFDHFADRHGLEKIKTIGDAYLVVGGLPEPHEDAIGAVAAMAVDMRAAARAWSARTGRPLGIRIGVHTGPVVAGIIGRRKFAYDLWGDTVNTASRMESHGEPDRIHVTEAVALRLADRFHVEARSPITVKGKGRMTTWWLEPPAVRDAASARTARVRLDGDGIDDSIVPDYGDQT